jgi:GntR family transcriptional regulator
MCYLHSAMSEPTRKVMTEFHLDGRSGVPPYLQLVQQVKRALRLGVLQVGDQLPTVREVVAGIAINPNTVLKAYRDLEREGLVASRPGQGTFVLRTLAGAPPAALPELRRELRRWIEAAHRAGLDGEGVLDLMTSTFREAQAGRERSA